MTPGGGVNPSGDLPPSAPPGYTTLFADDFDYVAQSDDNGHLNAGGDKWWGYEKGTHTTNSTRGIYDPGAVVPGTSDTVVSTDGQFMNIKSYSDANGDTHSAAEVPNVSAYQYGEAYIRIKENLVPGFASVVLNWPDDDVWDSEIDWYEDQHDGLNGPLAVFNHCPGNASVNCDSGTGPSDATQWHTFHLVWTSTHVTVYVDGSNTPIMDDVNDSPQRLMRTIIQAEGCTDDYCPDDAHTTGTTGDDQMFGTTQVDWIRIFTP
jgi:glycosyl hydrolase family 16